VALDEDMVSAVGEFAAKEVAPRVSKIDQKGTRLVDGEVVFSEELTHIFDGLREMGLYGLTLPREHGGMNAPFSVYFVIAEYLWGQTIGKRMFNLRVVRESGAQISFGQSVVRQLPALLQMWWIDVLFALFTEKSQRAFEVLSKTRCVRADSQAASV
jgi:alkylation response protein AidB-like acyl-CoA dehydrogenase